MLPSLRNVWRKKLNTFQLRTIVTLIAEPFGQTQCKNITKYTWFTNSGLSISVINYGGIISNISYPDKFGWISDVVLGFDDLERWSTANTPYFGCTVGRCANIISNAQFKLDGKTYTLPKNNGNNSLHGGLIGFDKAVWNDTVKGTALTLSYLSDDGEEGYPGDLITNVTFDVCDNDILHVDILSHADKPTIVNLTNHSYFNLGGHDAGPDGLYDHCITINAYGITADGGIKPVDETSFDLRNPALLGDVKNCLPDLYDNNFCVYTHKDKAVRFLACAFHAPSGRFMEVHSDSPGVQFYTGNFLPGPTDDPIQGKGGCCYTKHGGFCLQPQHYPDAINHKSYPSPILWPGSFFMRTIKYRFGAHMDSGYPAIMKLPCPKCP